MEVSFVTSGREAGAVPVPDDGGEPAGEEEGKSVPNAPAGRAAPG
ncbi:hypothetical protein [Acetobacter malorum]